MHSKKLSNKIGYYKCRETNSNHIFVESFVVVLVFNCLWLILNHINILAADRKIGFLNRVNIFPATYN